MFVAIQGGGSETSNKVTVKAQSGYVAMGTGGFYSAQFDNFAIHTGIMLPARIMASITETPSFFF